MSGIAHIRLEEKEGLALKQEQEITRLEPHGNGTFIVHIQHRQNATWQGMVTWANEGKCKSFRSALELLKLIDGALDALPPETEVPNP